MRWHDRARALAAASVAEEGDPQTGHDRAGCHVLWQQAACAWLIRRFLDPEAEFVFVDDPEEVPDDSTPFDMRGVELSHHAGDCSFETFLDRYELTDPVLWERPRPNARGARPARTWRPSATSPTSP